MFLIPKAKTSVRVGLPTQALFIQTRGPLLVLRGRFCQVWWDGRGEGLLSLPGWPGHPEPSPPSEAEEGSVVSWRDQNAYDHF